MWFEEMSPKKEARSDLDNFRIQQEISFLRKMIMSLSDRLNKVTSKVVNNGGGGDLQNNQDKNLGGSNQNNRKKLTRRDLLKAGGAAATLLAGAKIADMFGVGHKDYGEGLSDWEFGSGFSQESERGLSNKTDIPEKKNITKSSVKEKQDKRENVSETRKQKEIRKSNERALVEVFEKQFLAIGRINISLNVKKMIEEYWVNEYGFGGRQALGLEQALKNLAPYYKEIKEVFEMVSEETGVDIPEDLIYLAVPESHCSAGAGSNAGARGFYQLVAGTARKYGLRVDKFIDERLNPIRNAEGAARYLAHLYTHDIGKLKEEWNEDEDKLRWKLVLSRYNGGKYFKRFRDEIKAGKRKVSYEDYLHSREDAINNYKEEVFKNGYFQIEISSIKELNSIIKKYNISTEEVIRLNGGGIALRKKIGRKEKIKLPVFRESFQYKVVSGDTISGLSKRYEVSQREIKKQNHLKSDNINIGQILQIKVGGDIYNKKRNSARLFFEKDLKSALENLNYPEKFFAIVEVMKQEDLFLTDEDDQEHKSAKSGIKKKPRMKKKKLVAVHPIKRKRRVGY